MCVCVFKVLHFLQNVNFVTPQGENVIFDSNGDSPPKYELINLQPSPEGTMRVVTVGLYDASLPKERQFTMNAAPVVWTGGSKEVHIHKHTGQLQYIQLT